MATEYLVRFTLSPAGAGNMQNKARCVSVLADSELAAISRVYARYPGRACKPYLVGPESGPMRKVNFGQIDCAETPVGKFITSGFGVGDIAHSIKEMPVERPSWSR